MLRLQLVTGLTLCSLVVGCGTSRPFARVSDRFPFQENELDPLALEPDQLSDGYKHARRNLQDAEKTMLSFARWKEDTGLYAEAKKTYREALTTNPDCMTARLGIARIERKTGRFEQSRTILMAAREKYPDDASIPLEIGRMYGERDDWNAAIAAYKSAVELMPDDETIRYELGLALANVARYDEAVAHLKYAVGESAALYNIGYLLHEDGRSDQAVDWFEQALEQHPDDRTMQLANSILSEIRASNSVPAQSWGASQSQIAVSRYSTVPQIQQKARTFEPAPAAMNQQLPGQTAVASVSASVQAVSQPARITQPVSYTGQSAQQPSQWRGRGQSTKTPVTTTNWSHEVQSPGPVDPPVWR